MTRHRSRKPIIVQVQELKDLITEEHPFPLAPREKTQYTELHKSLKHKGGKPPTDYRLVEVMVDLDLALTEGDHITATILLSQARKLIYGG